MKLADYMHRIGITPGQLRVMLGVKSRTTVLRYIKGERTPHRPILKKIERLSGGLVTLDDFLDPNPPDCARIVIDRMGRKQLVFPWTNVEQHRGPRAANDNWPDRDGDRPGQSSLPFWELIDSAATEPWPSRPLQAALDELGTRVRPSVRGNFLLDGRQVDARRLVAEANRVRTLNGRPLIRYPGVEPVQ